MFHFLVAQMFVPFAGSLQPSTRYLRAAGKGVTRKDAFARRDDFRARIDAWFSDADAWITPTVPLTPPAVGAFRDTPAARVLDEAAPYGAFTAVFNASGHPATSIPFGRDEGGLPIGVQIATPRGEDIRALALGGNSWSGQERS